MYTSKGEQRGYIDAHTLKELWFHTGTKCNLSCPFCLEGSSPTSDRLDYLTLEEVEPVLKKAVDLGVEQFSFTGGEPFLNKAMLPILREALRSKPCLILTNGTKPLLQKMGELDTLKGLANSVNFRISIDSLERDQHDKGRGEGSYDLAMESMRRLQEMGFKVSMARHAVKGENREEVDDAFRGKLREYGIQTEHLNIVAFPDFLTPGSKAEVPEITTSCMTTYQNEESRKEFMCSYSRMVIKRKGRLKFSACTLVDDDDQYDLSEDLEQSLKVRVPLVHHRCFSCFSFGASCSETA